MNYGESLFNYCKKHNLGKWTTNTYAPNKYFEFSEEEINRFHQLDMLFDGRKGGLVLGQLHTQGGIHMVHQINNSNLFKYVGEMEGGEYLSAPLNNNEKVKIFETYNSLCSEMPNSSEITFDIPKNCKIIDTRESTMPILLIKSRHFIINRYATKNFIDAIIEIDNEKK